MTSTPAIPATVSGLIRDSRMKAVALAAEEGFSSVALEALEQTCEQARSTDPYCAATGLDELERWCGEIPALREHVHLLTLRRQAEELGGFAVGRYWLAASGGVPRAAVARWINATGWLDDLREQVEGRRYRYRRAALLRVLRELMRSGDPVGRPAEIRDQVPGRVEALRRPTYVYPYELRGHLPWVAGVLEDIYDQWGDAPGALVVVLGWARRFSEPPVRQLWREREARRAEEEEVP